jgi:hypothetical protein
LSAQGKQRIELSLRVDYRGIGFFSRDYRKRDRRAVKLGDQTRPVKIGIGEINQPVNFI